MRRGEATIALGLALACANVQAKPRKRSPAPPPPPVAYHARIGLAFDAAGNALAWRDLDVASPDEAHAREACLELQAGLALAAGRTLRDCGREPLPPPPGPVLLVTAHGGSDVDAILAGGPSDATTTTTDASRFDTFAECEAARGKLVLAIARQDAATDARIAQFLDDQLADARHAVVATCDGHHDARECARDRGLVKVLETRLVTVEKTAGPAPECRTASPAPEGASPPVK